VCLQGFYLRRQVQSSSVSLQCVEAVGGGGGGGGRRRNFYSKLTQWEEEEEEEEGLLTVYNE